jgi:hypothetical protein
MIHIYTDKWIRAGQIRMTNANCINVNDTVRCQSINGTKYSIMYNTHIL